MLVRRMTLVGQVAFLRKKGKFTQNVPNVAVEYLALSLHIREVSGLNLSQDTGACSWFSSVPQFHFPLKPTRYYMSANQTGESLFALGNMFVHSFLS